jgi:hypothetical protein
VPEAVAYSVKREPGPEIGNVVLELTSLSWGRRSRSRSPSVVLEPILLELAPSSWGRRPRFRDGGAVLRAASSSQGPDRHL